MQKFALQMLISGGQTGVDRAGLDFAIQAGIPCSGWCPLGRRAEDGAIPDLYPLHETTSNLYQQRTRLNVRDSEATLIFAGAGLSRGTALTIDYCNKLLKPFLIVSISDELSEAGQNLQQRSSAARRIAKQVYRFMISSEPFNPEMVKIWLYRVNPTILNLAGPRASECPTAANAVAKMLEQVLLPAKLPPPEWPPRRPFTPNLLYI